MRLCKGGFCTTCSKKALVTKEQGKQWTRIPQVRVDSAGGDARFLPRKPEAVGDP